MTTHPFSHLGPAPYKLAAIFSMPDKSLLETNPTAYEYEMHRAPAMEAGLGTCSHCTTAIKQIFVVECGDGTRWGVGCDCILQIGGSGQLVTAVWLAKKKAARLARYTREQCTIAEAEDWISTNRDVLADLPHPKGWADQSALDQLNWTWVHAGVSGKIKAYNEAKSAL